MDPDHQHIEETYPAQAQFRALRAGASVLGQLARDLKSDNYPEAREIFGVDKLSATEIDLCSQAVMNVAAELDLRAEQVYRANVRYLEAFLRRN